jgi:hypothetical protein
MPQSYTSRPVAFTAESATSTSPRFVEPPSGNYRGEDHGRHTAAEMTVRLQPNSRSSGMIKAG